jgi:uncharacterized C2H2 Zn-finger protein
MHVMDSFGPDHVHVSSNVRPRQSTSNDMLIPQPTPNSQSRKDPSSFELNLLRRRLTATRAHIVAQATMAQKDEKGYFSWVEFEPGFHSPGQMRILCLECADYPFGPEIVKEGNLCFQVRATQSEERGHLLRSKAWRRNGDLRCPRAEATCTQTQRAFKRERIRENNKLLEISPSDLAPLADAEGRRCEVCDRLFRNRKSSSRYACVSKGFADAKTGKTQKQSVQMFHGNCHIGNSNPNPTLPTPTLKPQQHHLLNTPWQ